MSNLRNAIKRLENIELEAQDAARVLGDVIDELVAANTTTNPDLSSIRIDVMTVLAGLKRVLDQ